MSTAILTRSLTKDYGQGRGLFDLELEVDEGEVFGFLGPNGAGKSTTIRLLMALIHPTRGSATIFDLDCQRRAVEVKRLVGYVPGELPEFGSLRGREIVAYIAGMAGGVDPAHVKQLTQRLGLDLSQRFREYSRGNKQKLALVLGFMRRPRLLILDEPTSGLDPLNQQEFYRMVAEVRAEGGTVFLSSHVLSEVEHICDHVGIIRAGNLVKVASLEELHAIRMHRVEIQFVAEPPMDRIRAADGVDAVEAHGHRVSFVVRGTFAPVLAAIADANVVELTSHEPSLEEMFLAYYSGVDDPEAPAPAAPS